MLIELEVKIKLPIIVFFILHEGMFEKFVDVILDKQGVSKNAHGLNNRAVDLIIMFNDTNETVRDDSDMNLDTDGIFAFAPEGLNLEMLFNPFEEQFDLPPVFIKECKLFIDSVITESIGLGDDTSVGSSRSETEIVRTFDFEIHGHSKDTTVQDSMQYG